MKNTSKPDEAGSLGRIQVTASTARVLNLQLVGLENLDCADYRSRPLFANRVLNNSIIVKHKLRPNEAMMFDRPRATATKLLLMLDRKDLKIGARSVFIGQSGYLDLLREAIGVRADTHAADIQTLRMLDDLPSLDPFIVREQLKTFGRDPAPCYLTISPADSAAIFNFALAELMPLATLMCSSPRLAGAYAEKLARKVIFNVGKQDFEPLRTAMRLDEAEFIEGMFCWKAFIYYKWRLNVLNASRSGFERELGGAVARWTRGHSMTRPLMEARTRVLEGVRYGLAEAADILSIYDEAYASMTQSGKTAQFRDFLMLSPSFFHALSTRIGEIDHVVSFWRHRLEAAGDSAIPGDEFLAILEDFCFSLDADRPPPSSMAPPSPAPTANVGSDSLPFAGHLEALAS